MVFTDLPIDIQEILIENSMLFSKKLLFFSVLAISVLYLFYWRKHVEKKTPFFTVMALRLLFTAICFSSLLATPLMMTYFTPMASFGDMLNIYLILYGIVIVILMIMVSVDIMYFSPMIVLKLCNVDVNDDRVDKVFRKIFGRRFQNG